jgi:2-polyprenyl-6-methoxyphenol hydroxylase-like FAD-dependent oxidoreductase
MSGSVIVVGAGPAGATLGYLLASRGVEVTLLERQRDFSREFRGEILLPSGLAALDEMGLRDLFDDVPHTRPTSIALYANAEPVFEIAFDRTTVGPNPPTAFSQPDFLEAVIAAARKHASFRVELGASVGKLLYDDGRVAGVAARCDGEDLELRADLVIGADGRTSAVRRHGQFEARRHGLDVDIVWFKLPLPEFMSGGAPVRVYVGRAHLLIAYRAANGLLQVAWVITKGSFGELRRRGVEEWIAEIAEHVTPDLAAHLSTHRGALTHPFLLSAVSDRVVHWSLPGALLIGDAAHTMSPVGGQGINIALRDAVVAANHLVPALAKGDPVGIDTAAQAVERERLPELARIQRMQAIPPRILMGYSWWGSALRAVVPRLLRLAPVRAGAARGIRPILFGLGEVKLEV